MGRTALTQPDRLDLVRTANDRIGVRAETLRFMSRVPMICECHDPSCDTLVLIDLESFHALRAAGMPIMVDGHTA